MLSHFVTDGNAESADRASGDLVDHAVEYIWNHTHTDVGVPEVARHLDCGRRTLETRFKQATGKTVLEEIQTCRLDRALHLLESTDLPIKQIVYRSGFQSGEQMRLVFQKKLGKSPSESRRGI